MYAVNSFVVLLLVYVANCEDAFLPATEMHQQLPTGTQRDEWWCPVYILWTQYPKKATESQRLHASYITPCDFKSDKFTDCVKEQIQIALPKFTKGIPEMDVPSIDPVQLKNIEIGGNGLNLTFTDAAMHGISECKLTELKVEFSKTEGIFSLSFKGNLSLTAQYVADGRILILPIQGNGDAFIYAQGVEVHIDSKLVHDKDGNGDHLKLITPKFKYTIERTTFDLKNLFNGNKQLAETTLQFANENWQQLMDELSPPAIKQIVRTCVKAINKFFSKVTINQIIKGYSDE